MIKEGHAASQEPFQFALEVITGRPTYLAMETFSHSLTEVHTLQVY